MERAKSEPRRTGDDVTAVNPFWSERLRENIAVQSSRPRDLPPDDQSFDDDELPPLRDESGSGKGRGERVATSGASGSGQFVTPPSRKSWRRAVGDAGVAEPRNHGRQTEGSMPVEEPATTDVKSMGRLPMGNDEIGDDENDDEDGLKRALEQAMFTQLQEQNARLLEEISRLKGQGQRSSGSTGSWSEVTPDEPSKRKRAPPTRDDGGGSPSRPGTSGPNEARFTPNWTRVPNGEPPGVRFSGELVPAPPSICLHYHHLQLCLLVTTRAGLMGMSWIR